MALVKSPATFLGRPLTAPPTRAQGHAMGQLAEPLAGVLTPKMAAALREGLENPATRDTSVAWMTFMGIPQEGLGVDTYDRLADYSKAPADEAWVYACVARIFNAAGSVPFRVYVQKGRELVPWEDEPTPAAEDLQTLLDTVNPEDMTGSEMRGYIAAARKIWGGWYLKKVQGRLLHDTQELYFLNVPDVTPKSQNGRAIDTYIYRPTRAGSITQSEDIDPRMMIRHRGLNLRSNVDMISPLSAARYDMVTDSAAAMRTASILRRRGVPEGYWSGRQGVELGTQDKTAIRRFLRQLVGPKNAGKALVAPDIEFHAIDLPEKDAQWLAGRKVSRVVVSAILGVPMVLAGDDEHAGVYRSVRDAQGVFWRDTMCPEMDADADTFNNWLTPEFNRPGDPKLVVAADYSKVEALKPLWTEEITAWTQLVLAQVRTPNQLTRHFKLGEDVPWGDKPVPRTTLALKSSDPGVLEAAPTIDPEDVAVPELVGTIDTDQEPDDAETLRSIRLYAHPAVRAFIGGAPLNVRAIFGHPVSPGATEIIRDGITRRQSATQIADRLAAAKDEVIDAVLGQLRKQWPPEQLEIVKQGTWTLDPSFPLKKVNADRRPIPRNPKIVEGDEAALAVGAPMAPITLVHTKVIGEPGYTPIDGWHRAAAADKQGVKKVPAYVGEGDAEWVKKILAFNDTIPTPEEPAVKMSMDELADKIVTAIRDMPAPVVNVEAPIVNVEPPVIRMPKPARTHKIVMRDDAGNITEVIEKEI